MLRLLGKVWPVGGPLFVSSQRGKGPFGVGCNGVTPTRSSPVNPVARRGFSLPLYFGACPGLPWVRWMPWISENLSRLLLWISGERFCRWVFARNLLCVLCLFSV